MKDVVHPLLIMSILSLSSCLMSGEKHEDFMARSECWVYNDYVDVDCYTFGCVHSIDTSEAGECNKVQLDNVQLLYMGRDCIGVYNAKPQDHIDDIQYYKALYHTNSTRLSDYIVHDSTIVLCVKKYCKDSSNVLYGDYIDWRQITYDRKNRKQIRMDVIKH